MFLFRFVQYLFVSKDDHWLNMYNRLCEDTDFLYLRKLEISSTKKTAIILLLMNACFGWLLFRPEFRTFSFITISILFFLVSTLYLLAEFTYVPLEIEKTRIYARESKTRKSSAVVSKGLKDYFHLLKNRQMEQIHPYFVYATESRKKAIDMTDRILGEDQEYEEGEWVYCFSAMNNNQYYVLPILSNNTKGESDENFE